VSIDSVISPGYLPGCSSNQPHHSSINPAVTTPDIPPTEQIIDSDNVELLRKKIREAAETIRNQEAIIKKKSFELEMEQGHVNILRHDNQMLRQMTVDMACIGQCPRLLLESFTYILLQNRVHLLSKKKNISVTSC
jgi:hypothetical protein